LKYVFSQDLGKMNDYHASILTEIRFNFPHETGLNAIRRVSPRIDEPIQSDIHVIWVGRSQESYDKLIQDTRSRLWDPRLYNHCYHVVDATGVGLPVLDLMHQSQLSPIGIWITAGATSNRTEYGYTVPKDELISSLQMVLSTNRLKFSDKLEPELVAQLRHEFQNFKEKKTKTLGTTYEAWRESDHDDMVLSLAMNIWWALKTIGQPRYLGEYLGRESETLTDWNPLADF